MRVVITNDDGHDEPGLKALHEAVRPLGEVVIVAPEAPQSGVGHSITLKDDVYVEKTNACKYIVKGSPADCARMALKVFAPDADWLISGINPGANLGTDVYPSGTVAAAREAAIIGCRAMAVSQYVARGEAIDWQATAFHAARIVRLMMKEPLAAGEFWNINLPHPIRKEMELRHSYCSLEKQPHAYRFVKNGNGYSYLGSVHDRPRLAGSDVYVCYSGMISVSRLER
jgi:5'-nucleotidase